MSPLAFQLVGFRRMEATLAEMKEHEQQTRAALELEDAVRVQYARQHQLATRARTTLGDYDAARARVAELTEWLAVHIDEPDAMAWMREIQGASDELDRVFRERIIPASLSGDPAAIVEHDRTYPLVALIEGNVDRIFGQLQETTSTFRAQLAASERSALSWTALLLVVTPALVAAAILYLSHSVGRPLARLRAAAAAIASGDLGTRVDIATRDEFGELATELNAMTASLAQHQRRLVESEKLASVGRLAAGVAHELNNPLQVMLGYLSLDRDVEDRAVARRLAAVEAEVLRCRDIVDSLLDLSRPSVDPVPIELRPICEGVASRVAVSSGSSGVRVTVEGGAVARADPAKLDQVLFNLVKNATEAAGSGGSVAVAIAARGEDVEVAVTDTGPGIPPDGLSRIFEPFFTTKPSGTGLGLAVSRAIAHAHGGDIEARNGEAGGAVFTLRLPGAPGART